MPRSELATDGSRGVPGPHSGRFTEALKEALGGKADANADGAIGVRELSRHLTDRVEELTDKAQSPLTAPPGADGPLARVAGSGR